MAGLKTKPPVAKAPVKGKKPAAAPAPGNQNYTGLNPDQNTLVNQRTVGDTQLGSAANNSLGSAVQNYSQPLDYSKLPSAPVTGDYNNWVQSQMQNYDSAYDARMKPVESQQNEDFEQQMANRGIPMGSDLYNQQKAQLQQSQGDNRTQAYASDQGQAVAGASQLFDVGTQARSNALGEATQQRNAPLNDYNQLLAAQSPMAMQNLAYSQTLGSQNNQTTDSIKASQQGYHGSGGGSSGAAGLGGYQGTGMSFQDYLNAQNQSKLALQQGLNTLNPPPTTPSYGAQIGGSILGTGLGILGSYAVKNL